MEVTVNGTSTKPLKRGDLLIRWSLNTGFTFTGCGSCLFNILYTVSNLTRSLFMGCRSIGMAGRVEHIHRNHQRFSYVDEFHYDNEGGGGGGKGARREEGGREAEGGG